MQTHNLQQGTPEWAAHRAQYLNASDAPAMMGCSTYKTRQQLLQEHYTGITQEFDAATQRRLNDGHRFEALARPLAAKIIGEEVYPVVGTDGELGASFDGLTMAEDVNFEHKSLNDSLRYTPWDEGNGDHLPLQYRVQMEQQMLVSGAERSLFMASKWDGDTLVEERHCWYVSDPALAAKIISGWAQFKEDLATFVPSAPEAKLVAQPVAALPAVVVTVEGKIAITDNFPAFETAIKDFLEHRLIRKPESDQDFADLDTQIKAMKGAEAALNNAEANWIAQIDPISQAKSTKDMLLKLVVDNRRMAERLLEDEKDRRRGEIVAGGVAKLKAHIDSLNTRLGKPYMPAVPVDFGGAIKGKRNLTAMEDAVATTLANAKIAANEVADRIQTNLGTLRDLVKEHAFLFADTGTIVLKACDDLTMLVKSRISEHQAAEERRLEQERERIRQEEAAKLQREAEQREAAERAEAARKDEAEARAAQPAAQPTAPITHEAVTSLMPASVREAMKPAAKRSEQPTLPLGEISNRLGFNVTGAFLATLGFEATTVKAAKLFHEADFPAICQAVIAHVSDVAAQFEPATV